MITLIKVENILLIKILQLEENNYFSIFFNTLQIAENSFTKCSFN